MAEGGRRERESKPMESRKRNFAWNSGSGEVGIRLFLGGVWEGLSGGMVVVLEERNLVVVLRWEKEGKLGGFRGKVGLDGGVSGFPVVVRKLRVSCIVERVYQLELVNKFKLLNTFPRVP